MPSATPAWPATGVLIAPKGRAAGVTFAGQIRAPEEAESHTKALCWISVSCRKPPNPSSAILYPRKQLEPTLTFSPTHVGQANSLGGGCCIELFVCTHSSIISSAFLNDLNIHPVPVTLDPSTVMISYIRCLWFCLR